LNASSLGIEERNGADDHAIESQRKIDRFSSVFACPVVANVANLASPFIGAPSFHLGEPPVVTESFHSSWPEAFVEMEFDGRE
jgi:hypothetical protein